MHLDLVSIHWIESTNIYEYVIKYVELGHKNFAIGQRQLKHTCWLHKTTHSLNITDRKIICSKQTPPVIPQKVSM